MTTNLTIAEFNALTTYDGSYEIEDTGANIEALSYDDLLSMHGLGVASFAATDDLTLSGRLFSYPNIYLMTGMTFSSAGSLAVQADSTSFAFLDFASITSAGITTIDYTDTSPIPYDVIRAMHNDGMSFESSNTIEFWTSPEGLSFTVGDLQAMNVDAVVFNADGLMSLALFQSYEDTGLLDNRFSASFTLTVYADADSLTALSAAELQHMADLGVDYLKDSVDSEFHVSLSFYNEMLDAGLNFSPTQTGVLDVTPADIEGLNATEIAALSVVTLSLSSTDGDYDLTMDQALALANLDAVSGTPTVVVALDHAQSLTATEVAALLGHDDYAPTMQFTGGQEITVSGSGDEIEALAGTFGTLAGWGVDQITVTDGAARISLDDFSTMVADGIAISGDVHVEIANTGPSEYFSGIAAVGALGGTVVAFTGGGTSINLDQLQAAIDAGVTFATEDAITLYLTPADVLGATAATLQAYHAAGIDSISLLSDNVSLTTAEAEAFINAGLSFTGGGVQYAGSVADVVAASQEFISNMQAHGISTGTVYDTGANIAAIDITTELNLYYKGFYTYDATDNAITVDFGTALGYSRSGIRFGGDDVVTLTTDDLNDYIANNNNYAVRNTGADYVSSPNGAQGVTVVTVQRMIAAGLQFTDSDTFILSDSGANLETLSASTLQSYQAIGIDALTPTDGVTIDFAQTAIGAGMPFVDGKILDASSSIFGLSGSELTSLADGGVTELWATDGFSMSLAEFQAFADAGFTLHSATGSTAVVEDSATLLALTSSELQALGDGGIDTLDCSDSGGSLTVAHALTIHAAGLVFQSDDAMTIADTAADIEVLSASDFTKLGAMHVTVIDSSDDSLTLTAAQAKAAIAGGIAFTSGDTVVLQDSAANIEALSTSVLTSLIAENVDTFDVTGDGKISLSYAQAIAALASPSRWLFADGDVATVVVSQNDMDQLDITHLVLLRLAGFQYIDGSDDLSFDAAQGAIFYSGNIPFADDAHVSMSDTGLNIQFFVAAYGILQGVDSFDATGDMTIPATSMAEALDAGVVFSAAGTFTMTGSASDLQGFTVAQLEAIGAMGVDIVDCDDSALTLPFEKFEALYDAGVRFGSNDALTLTAKGSLFDAISAASYYNYALAHVIKLDATDNSVTISVAHLRGVISANITFASDDVLTLSDTIDNIAALSASDLSVFYNAGVRIVGGSTVSLVLSIDQGVTIVAAGMVFDSGDHVSLEGSAADIEALSTATLLSLADAAVVTLKADDDLTLSYSEGLMDAISAGLHFTSATGKLILTGDVATLNALSASDLYDLGDQSGSGAGFNVLEASSTNFSTTLDFATAVVAASMVFADGNYVTLGATVQQIEALSASQITALGAAHVDFLSTSALYFDALGFDSALAIGSAGLLSGATGSVTTSKGLTVSVADMDAIIGSGAFSWIKFDDSHAVTLSDTAENIAAYLSGRSDLYGIDVVSTTDAPAEVGYADLFNLIKDNISFAGEGAEALVDATAFKDALSSLEFLAKNGVDTVVLTGGSGTLDLDSVSTAFASGLSFDSGDVVTVAADAAALEALAGTDFTSLAAHGVDRFTATADVSLSLDQLEAFVNAGLTLSTTGNGIVADTGTALSALSDNMLSSLAASGFDRIEAAGDLTWSLETFEEAQDDGVTLSATGDIVLADSADTILALTSNELRALADQNVDRIGFSGGSATMTLAKAMLFEAAGIPLRASDVITVSVSATDVAGFSTDDIADLAAIGVDTLDQGSTALTISYAKAMAMSGNLSFSGAGSVTVDMTDDEFASLWSGGLAGLGIAGAGTDIFDVSGGNVVLTLTELSDLYTAQIVFAEDNTVALADGEVAAFLESLTESTTEQVVALFSYMRISTIDTETTQLSLTLAQAELFGQSSITFVNAAKVSVTGTAAEFMALTADDIATLKSHHLSNFVATDDVVTFDLADALARATMSVTFTAADGVIVADTPASFAALTVAEIDQLGTLSTTSTVWLDASGKGAYTLDKDQAAALAAAGIKLASGDVVTLDVTVAEAKAFASTDAATYHALGIDTFDIADTGSAIAALTAAQIASLGENGIAAIDATDNAVTLNVAQHNAFAKAHISFAAADKITLADKAAALQDLSAKTIKAMGAAGVDTIDVSGKALGLSIAQMDALHDAGIAVAKGDTLTLVDTGGMIGKLSVAEIGALKAMGLDAIDASNNRFTLSVTQYNAMAPFAFAANDTVTVVGTKAVDTIAARANHTVLDGLAGNDVLTGGKGDDVFLFDSKLGSDNVDHVKRFSVADDQVELDHAIFKGLHDGTLSSKSFFIGKAAHDADDRIIYDDRSGALYYDSDGNGHAAAVKFAVLDKGLHLGHDDFMVV